MSKISTRDFCVWMQGYLESCDTIDYEPIKNKLKEVDMSEKQTFCTSPILNPPYYPNTNQPYYIGNTEK